MHYTLLAVGENWEGQMKPYDQWIDNNPNGEWDWYQVGGGFLGYFKLKKGANGKLGYPAFPDMEPTYDADQALKKDIDWEGMGHREVPSALLKDGKWHGLELTTLDLFAEAMIAWARKFHQLLEEIDDDEILTVVDCHR